MAEEFSIKAKTTLRELSQRSTSDQPLMVEWDVETELEKRDFISAGPNGGWLITEAGRAHVREMDN